MPIQDRIQQTLKHHKKKAIFFTCVASVLQYYGCYSWVSRKYKNVEPWRKRLRRWILKEKNLPGESLREISVPNTYSISRLTMDEIGDYYYQIDKELFFGVGYHYMYEIFRNLGVLYGEDVESNKKHIYQQSIYKRRINQECCGMQFSSYMRVIEKKWDELLKKAKKEKDFVVPFDSFEQFVQKCAYELKNLYEDHKYYQKNLIQQR